MKKKIYLSSGIYLINFSYNHQHISPFFIIVLLWYPCFELLFSMIRRLIKKSETYKPDTNHLHQLIYYFIKKNLNFRDPVIHFSISFFINSFNLLVFIFATNFIYSSKILIFIILANIFAYISLYVFLKKKMKSEVNK